MPIADADADDAISSGARKFAESSSVWRRFRILVGQSTTMKSNHDVVIVLVREPQSSSHKLSTPAAPHTCLSRDVLMAAASHSCPASWCQNKLLNYL